MSTVTLWLLISLPSLGYGQRPATLVERFPTVVECQRVAAVIATQGQTYILQCIQATVVKP